MRRAILAVISMCALAACNPSNSTSNSADNNAGSAFPDTSGSAYRAEATITDQEGHATPVVMIRDGRKMRMEFTSGDGPAIFITNGDTGESYIISTQGGQTIAMRATGMGETIRNPLDEWQGEVASTSTRTGDCSFAGERGSEWTKTTSADGTDTVCVTDDGVILRATDDGRVVWETTSVQRGAQSAELFALPQGVQVVDLGNMGAIMNEAIEAAKQRGN